jgi:hypothetical protein
MRNPNMPTLLEMQSAMRQSLVFGDKTSVFAMLSPGMSADRLDIYRNTFLVALTRALRLCFPAVVKLVADDFFEGAAQIFIAEHLPRAAWLDRYGSEFADFLERFEPAQSVPYLAEVARLEWAVNVALHAEDTERLNPTKLTGVSAEDQARIRLIPEPSISLLELAYPVDLIWNAVLSNDSVTLGEIDLGSGPIDLLIERRPTGVVVERLAGEAWRFLAKLYTGEPIEAAIRTEKDFDLSGALAEHLAVGRFTGFDVAPADQEHPI